ITEANGGILYFPHSERGYRIASGHPEYPEYGLVVAPKPGVGEYAGGNLRMMGGGSPRVFADVRLAALLYWPRRLNNMAIEALEFDGASRADYAWHAASEYC